MSNFKIPKVGLGGMWGGGVTPRAWASPVKGPGHRPPTGSQPHAHPFGRNRGYFGQPESLSVAGPRRLLLAVVAVLGAETVVHCHAPRRRERRPRVIHNDGGDDSRETVPHEAHSRAPDAKEYSITWRHDREVVHSVRAKRTKQKIARAKPVFSSFAHAQLSRNTTKPLPASPGRYCLRHVAPDPCQSHATPARLMAQHIS